MTDIKSRKQNHLTLCTESDVEFSRKTTLLEEVQFIHNAVPELHWDDIDLSVELLGKRLKLPIVIASMTGGAEEAAKVNHDLARVAEKHGLAIGVGSQRAMHKDRATGWTYQIREQAPNALVIGNLGLVQARQMSTAEVLELVRAIAADALIIHLNPAMELIQVEGDRDFRDGYDCIRRLVEELPCPVVAKETGCGISRRVGLRLKEVGVRAVDVSGAGGTSWVGVETLRLEDETTRRLGREFWDWGIPTAASVLGLRDLGLEIIATGGIRSGLDVAKSIALGATAAGLALPFLRSHATGGIPEVERFLAGLSKGIRMACLLTGSGSLQALQRQNLLFGPGLEAWARAMGLKDPFRRREETQ